MVSNTAVETFVDNTGITLSSKLYGNGRWTDIDEVGDYFTTLRIGFL